MGRSGDSKQKNVFGRPYSKVGWLCWGLTSQSTIFQSCRDGAIASWVINQYFRGVKCLAQGHNTAAVGFEPRTSRSGVRHSTTEPPRSPYSKVLIIIIHTVESPVDVRPRLLCGHWCCAPDTFILPCSIFHYECYYFLKSIRKPQNALPRKPRSAIAKTCILCIFRFSCLWKNPENSRWISEVIHGKYKSKMFKIHVEMI